MSTSTAPAWVRSRIRARSVFELGPNPAVSGPIIARRDIRDLSEAEQRRVCDAIEKMMEPGWQAYPDSGVPDEFPSEYFRLASYHGWPGEYCAHRSEAFPGWHRAYLVEFERTLQAADQALGNNASGTDKLALPYWGWERGAVNGQLFPAVVRQRFSVMRDDLIPDPDTDIARNGYALNSDAAIAQSMSRARVTDQVRLALQQLQHPLAASTAGRNANSVETPHNTMHGVCGWPMTSVTFAAYHPIFFLHHCNVDRIYEAYLKNDIRGAGNTANAPWREFEVSSRDLYLAPLTPFKHPANGQDFLPRHTFYTEPLGYSYDTLPIIPPARLSELPTLALFEEINPNKLAGRSYALHVFVAAKDDTAFAPPASVDDYDTVPQYGGMNGIFGSKTGQCDNCDLRDPVDIQVDVTDALKAQGLSRHTARAVAVVVDIASGEQFTCAAASLPEPQLVGPFFEDTSMMLGRKDAPGEADGVEEGEAAQLQRYLAKYGWYSGEIDGFYGPQTEAAVRKFQEFYGLTVDGIAGPETRTLMLHSRMDDKEDEADLDDAPNFPTCSVVRWWAGGCPGYLDEEAVRDEVEDAIHAWAQVLPLAFLEVSTKEEAQLTVTWGDRSRDNMFRFDGPGGALAYAQGGHIVLDLSEYWLMQGAPAVKGGFYLQPVVLHEIGHALGLTHSQAAADVMSPFYVPDRIKLAPGDATRAAGLYPVSPELSAMFATLDRNHDGLVSKEEFITSLTQHGSNPLPLAEAEALFARYDCNRSGVLRETEFAAMMARLEQE